MTTPGIPISLGDFLARVAVTGEALDSDPSYGGYDSWEVTNVASVDNSDPNYTVEVITVRQRSRP
jgi:hypothetical protein